MSEAIFSEKSVSVPQPTEEDAIRLLDEAKEALDEIREMKLENFIRPEIELADEVIDLEIVHTSSEADIIEFSKIIYDALPKEKEEKLFSKNVSEKNLLCPDTTPSPAVDVEIAPVNITTVTEGNQTIPDNRKRWATIRRIFSRNKTTNKI
ncbi:uncharacterized protein LOC106661874 [Cimex lectularius]|uniref:Uncharacterized protein n=1 Tax=Cimex lectularius TaxID=79782 RepID=A0A8I6R896_CIMLE|nr:uncharacterized protein LOC106661874 [Cimex lectularius]